MKFLLAIIGILFTSFLPVKYTYSQDSLQQKKLKIIVLTSAGAIYIATYTYLGISWYADYDFTQFHFFNDLHEWKQMDKLGHIYGAFQESRIMYKTMASLGDSSSLWTLTGFFAQLPVEILDGLSTGWGASYYDLIANLTGSALAYLNYKVFKKEIISMKFSFHYTPLPKQKPELLGKNWNQQILKDYNGQTYWFAFHPKNKVVGIAIGHSAYNMLGGYEQNPEVIKNEYRQWFLAPDIQFSNIKTNKKALKILFFLLDGIKFPTPALEYNRIDKVKFHLLYF